MHYPKYDNGHNPDLESQIFDSTVVVFFLYSYSLFYFRMSKM